MNELKIFNNAEFGQVRTTEINGQPYFMASDVAKALGYTNPRDAIARHCKGVVKRDTPTQGGAQAMAYIPEGDIYRLIIKSKLPGAERFEKWVMEEVLPTTRRTGTYSVPQTTTGQIQLLAQGHMELEQRIEDIGKEVRDFKENLPLLGADMDVLRAAVNTRVVQTLGGTNSKAYKDNSIRGKVYSDCWNELKRQFGFIHSYKELKRNQMEQALEVIAEYDCPIVLMGLIKEAKAKK